MKTHKHYLSKKVFLLPLILIMFGCGSQTPELPYFGAFLVDGNDIVELEQGTAFGVPRFNELDGIPLAPDSQPVVLLWQPDTQLQYLQLFSISPREELEFTANPIEDDVLELTPRTSLNPGRYCYIQGDPLGMGLPMWCFELAGAEEESTESDASTSNQPSQPSIEIPITDFCEISSTSPTSPFEGIWVNEAMAENIDLVGFQVCLDSEILTEDGDRWPVITIEMWGEGLRGGSATITVVVQDPIIDAIKLNQTDSIELLNENILQWNEPDSSSRDGTRFVQLAR